MATKHQAVRHSGIALLCLSWLLLSCTLAPALAAEGPAPVGQWQAASAPEPPALPAGPDAAKLERRQLATDGTPAAPVKMPVPHPLQEQFDVTRYGLDLHVDPHRQHLEGTVCVEIRVLTGPLATIVLDLLDPMVCTRAWRIDRALPVKVTQADGLLLLDLGRTFAAEESLSVHVEFNGRPEPHGLYGFQFYETSAGTAAAASLSEPWSARSWWPCKDDIADKAPFSVTLRVPEGMTGVSNGALVSPAAQMAASATAARLPLSTFVWEEPLPLSTYQFSVAVAEYVRLDGVYAGSAGNLDLRHWVYPTLVEPATRDFAILPQMLAFCEDRFGPFPFPGQKYGMALFEWDGAMEHPTATTYGSQFVTGDGYFETIIMHELSHQWFGDMVTCRDWTHAWLHEGFATYAEGLWKEFRSGPTALKWFMLARSDFTWWRDPLVRQADRTDPWFYFHNMVYYKGAWVLHMLRRLVGDQVFDDCLRQFASWPEYRYGSADSEDFAEICALTSGMELDWFFRQWLYWRVQPILRVSWRNLESGTLEVRVEQRQAADPDYGDLPFILPIELRVRGTGFDKVMTIWTAAKDQTVTLAPGGPVSSLTVDPNGWLLHKLESVVPLNGTHAPAVALEAAVPNPFNPRCRLAWRADVPTRDGLEIFDLRGRRVLSHEFPEQPAGLRTWVWDGRDAQGRDCPTGIYLYRIGCRVGEDAPVVLQGKLTLAR